MLFTSQYFNTGLQDSTACSALRSVSTVYGKNWHVAFLGFDEAGTPSEQCTMPGTEKSSMFRQRKSVDGMVAQNLFTMKNARKQLGEIASNASQTNPGPIVSDNPDSLPLFENHIFHEKPRFRQPESPDAESFRSWLKTNTPRHTASPALLERIRSITLDEKA